MFLMGHLGDVTVMAIFYDLTLNPQNTKYVRKLSAPVSCVGKFQAGYVEPDGGSLPLRVSFLMGIVHIHAFNPSVWETETGKCLHSEFQQL